MTEHNGQQHLTTTQLSSLLDNQLPIEEREFSDAHLATCEQCQHELESLRQTVMMLHALPRPELPRSFILPITTTQTHEQAPMSSFVPPTHSVRQTRHPYYARTAFRTIGTLAAMVGFVLLLSSLIPSLGIHSSGTSSTSSGTRATTTQGPALPHVQATATHEALNPQPTPQPSSPQSPLVSLLDISTIAGRAFLGVIFLIIGIIGLTLGQHREPRRGP